MKRGPKQDEFNGLVHAALMLMHEDKAEAVALVVTSSGPGQYDVDFAGNGVSPEAMDAFGYQLGQAMGDDKAVGQVITAAIKRGIEDHAAGKVRAKRVTDTPPTKH